MTLLKHELRENKKAFAIWTGTIAALLLLCILIYPEIKEKMEAMAQLMFSSMGVFSSALGLDKLNFSGIMGYYAMECENILGLGGAMFAALTAVNVLAKEERDKTAEFLLTHPVSRKRVVTGKLMAVFVQIALLNILVFLASAASIAAIGESFSLKDLALIHTAHFLLQIETAAICFGISACLSSGGIGIGLGLVLLLYFFNLISNITPSARFLKYLTPFAYTQSGEILSKGGLDKTLLFIGGGYALLGIFLAYIRYCRKDIR